MNGQPLLAFLGEFIAYPWRRLLARREPAPSIPDALWEEARAALPFFDWLDEDEWQRLRHLAGRFLHAKEFTAIGGLELSDAMLLGIAVQASLPVLNLGLERYQGWLGIVVYPDEFVINRQLIDEDGVAHEYREIAAGEASFDGPLLVSWEDVRQSEAGYSVVIHEIAHKLDMANGAADGFPPLAAGMSASAWEAALRAAYEDFSARVADGAASAIDPYAAENPGEFFAVLCETFFTAPHHLYAEYPAAYAQLCGFFRLDPLDNRRSNEQTTKIMERA